MPTAELDAALKWRDAVTEAVREAAPEQADELLDSVRFLETLDPLADEDPDGDGFAEAVAEAVEEHLAEADSSKPYGDVTYADNGLQDDGKKRYPLDSEEHCRAAWSYINMPKNAAKYSPDQLKTVKSRIRRALERYGIETSEADGERVTEGVEVEDHIEGRLLEARGQDSAGGRIFRVEIIKAGRSRNKRNYPAKVLREAVHLYEGAKAYDHHRSPDELRSSTIAGLVGSYRNVEATSSGSLEADLHLLPGAVHTAEALDASLEAQGKGLPPLVGISHDALTVLKPVRIGNEHIQEAVAITRVHSADVVADPAAGGKATRVLAGGIETDPAPAGESNEEEDVAITSEAVLEALQTATPEQLAAVGLSRTSEAEEPYEGEQLLDKGSFLGGLMIERKVEAAGLDRAVAESLAESLPARITESDVDWQIATLKRALGVAERAGLTPTVTVEVTKEARDKKIEALDAFFAGDFMKGYRSFRTAYLDITGHRQNYLGGEDLSRQILRESFGLGYDSGVRTTESGDSSTWAQVLGDSVTRRMVAEYGVPNLQTWRTIVSSIVPVDDFRTQRVGRMGGYGTLPTVAEGGPYQPLTTPGDEEATYALTKRGGTEDMTIEVLANDDRRVISKIPTKLGRAAAQTLYRFVWDMLISGNGVTCTYDSTVLFHANHSNTDTSAALSQTTLGVGRRTMRDQAAYGDTSEILALQPRYLIVPNELEELAFQLTTSAVAVPATAAGPSDTPNINSAQGLSYILVPYATDANDWFLVADPNMTPTLEIGFFNGREEPELFTQSDPNAGSVFNSDVFTWKIRHIYSGTAIDHRGFYRGQG